MNTNLSTGDVNTARAPGRAQGFLLFAGDGDNGTTALLFTPSGPDAGNPLGCSNVGSQANDGTPDDFDPPADQNISTGATRNTCRNKTDGSNAVLFEYRSFRIRSGVTVRFTGINPAIILVRGDVRIEAGGKLLARGDGGNGAPLTSAVSATTFGSAPTVGGVSVAGGGDGGAGTNTSVNAVTYGGNGTAGFGSPDAFLSPGVGGLISVRQGAGRGAVGVRVQFQPSRQGPSGGGGGHATVGGTGEAKGANTATGTLMDPFVDGAGGATYGDSTGRMRTAEAGSGGSGGGVSVLTSFANGSFNGVPGGGGGGGGFVDLTSAGDISVLGTIDVAGGRGADGTTSGGAAAGFAFDGSGGGGGGGSGGGIRLLTPKAIRVGATTVLTAIGGSGGVSGACGNAACTFLLTANKGGAGGLGRIALEDADSVIEGIAAATMLPGEGAPSGFYRGVFDASRFQGGGLEPQIVTDLIDIGPASPTYLAPNQTYGNSPVAAPGTPRLDFIAGIPAVASRGINTTSMIIEMQGFAANPDGTPSALGTGWKAVGHFKDSGSELFPTWALGLPLPGDVATPIGNAGSSIGSLDGNPFVQFRITFYLRSGMGPFDAGPYLDRWDLYFGYDQ